MIDYQAKEFKLMLDMADAQSLIPKVIGGLDVHQATADVAGITRKQAKFVNFGVLYGIGLAKLAVKLGVSLDQARSIRDSVFNAAPEIEQFIRNTTTLAERRGYCINWAGRRSYFPDVKFCYRAPNYIIQGGCADIIKIAMNKIHDFLKDKKSRMVLTIHDELVFEIHETELHICSQLKEMMEQTYPYKSLPLTCSVDHSYKSLADKVKGHP